ncbi:MAG TPA: flagellar basal body rod protein FlgC [Planctomycetaceae bacterium]|nr:flagellar basal body rod protein FlgC [Planctomycetaceae bacterium]
MFASLDISTSGLVAQQTRLMTISSNLANISSLRNENGELRPYQARYPVFTPDESMATPSGGVGVAVTSIETETIEPRYRYQPNHPLAIKSGKWKGYVAYPNINVMAEFVDALEATRAYEANLGVMELTKNMAQQTFQILV